jgi:predicted nucleotidyltransferase
MDAGVLQLHVFAHQAAQQPRPLLADNERIVPTLVAGGPVERTGPISLIVPTFFNEGLKRGSLQHLLAGIENSQAVQEVVLVAGTTGQAVDALTPLLGGKRLVMAECEPNQRARTRNLGAAAATHDHLLFLDDDMLLRGWSSIDVVLSCMLRDGYDCALFPRRHYLRFPLLFDAPRLRPTIAAWRSRQEGFDHSIIYDPLHHGCAFKMVAFCFPGCFMLIDRKSFDRIGGFPEDYEGWGFEDTVFAMRATSQLRVLNLFRKSEPLLHIDHPVSPYKSEEYGENGRRFFSSYNTLDVEWLCIRVLAGDDFAGQDNQDQDVAAYLRPLRDVVDSYRLPLPLPQATENYRELVFRRLTAGQSATPEFIALHGSRGKGSSRPDSDYDLLMLFRGGTIREFFVGQTNVGQPDQRPRVEIEYADLAKFEEIASRPAFFPLYGPMELAKLAQGLLLWGDDGAWRRWVDEVLEVAVSCGRELWLLVALGLELNAAKSGQLRMQFREALETVLRRADSGPAGFDEDLRCLASGDPQSLGRHIRAVMDRQLPDWHDELQRGRRVFAFQVPEIWTALQWIAQLR